MHSLPFAATVSDAPDPNALGDLDDFREVCAFNAWFFHQGWISLQTSVDNSQALAERWDLIATHGQDAVQAAIAAPLGYRPGAQSW